jgi:hypothetical protein
MSGRVRVELGDGRVVTGFRKTLRRRSPARPLIDRLHDLNEKYRSRFPQAWAVRMGFFLPETLAPFVADGPHGGRVNIIKGFVQVADGSFDECCITAEHFFADVAKGKPASIIEASVTSSATPRHYSAYLTVVNGALVVTSGRVRPKVYGDDAA